MSPERFEHCFKLVGLIIAKQDTAFRSYISPEEQLVAILQFLASGEDQQALRLSFRIAKSTISGIISETTEAI